MKLNSNILLYEKDKMLNSILTNEMSYLEEYQLCLVENKEALFKAISKEKFDTCIINLDDLEDDIFNFIEIFKLNNDHKNIIIYYQNELIHSIDSDGNIIYLKKPFKVSVLFNYLKMFRKNKYINHKEKSENIVIYLMKELVFLPLQKIIINKRTNKNEHLTEKENSLLAYLFQNQNSEISKKNLLNTVWNINENTNTHTIETHLYRLKQKLYKLEPKLSFSLIKENGKYFLRNIK